MKAHTLPVAAVLAAGVGMGSAGDYLLRAPGSPGSTSPSSSPDSPFRWASWPKTGAPA